uniref:Uncharacterized protein n=1 Tax=Knipowitschia caucasica TaxID=637954 RepID=A0AAV2LD80_KNICA
MGMCPVAQEEASKRGAGGEQGAWYARGLRTAAGRELVGIWAKGEYWSQAEGRLFLRWSPSLLLVFSARDDFKMATGRSVKLEALAATSGLRKRHERNFWV